eukprot:TRINITY_DN15482_c0_g1_i1.p1 TRINITY_DN15482_c0_g1~~TRINITY_DN15482_c0_g1_i1.p1  ORF type:complete len:136 (+),score=22.38 TRINITY_DN15482_c0_g1_i1:26-433(+)
MTWTFIEVSVVHQDNKKKKKMFPNKHLSPKERAELEKENNRQKNILNRHLFFLDLTVTCTSFCDNIEKNHERTEDISKWKIKQPTWKNNCLRTCTKRYFQMQRILIQQRLLQENEDYDFSEFVHGDEFDSETKRR